MAIINRSCRTTGPRARQSRVRGLVHSGIAALGLVLAAAGSVVAQDEDPGHFEVRAGSHDLVDGTYFVDAQIYSELEGILA